MQHNKRPPIAERTDFCTRSLQLDPSIPQPAALLPSSRNVLRQRLTIFSSKYYQVLTATHLPIPEG